MSDPIKVPAGVLSGIEAVRRSGRTNMLDRAEVIRIADELGLHETVLWVHQNKAKYAKGFFRGYRR